MRETLVRVTHEGMTADYTVQYWTEGPELYIARIVREDGCEVPDSTPEGWAVWRMVADETDLRVPGTASEQDFYWIDPD